MALTVSSVWMRSSSPKSMRSDSNALQEGVGPRRAFTALGPVRLASILTPFTVNLMDGVQGCGIHPHTPADPRLSLINWVPSKPPTPSGWRRGCVEQAPRRASPPALKLECRRARAETFFERVDCGQKTCPKPAHDSSRSALKARTTFTCRARTRAVKIIAD